MPTTLPPPAAEETLVPTQRTAAQPMTPRVESAPPPPTAADARPLIELRPPFLFSELRRGVLGQDKALRHVAVAIYKHTTGKVSGNLLLVGASGTGKTTIMNNIPRLYHEVPEYKPFRSVTIINANLLVDADRMEFRPDRLLAAVEQRARAILGTTPSAVRMVCERRRSPLPGLVTRSKTWS